MLLVFPWDVGVSIESMVNKFRSETWGNLPRVDGNRRENDEPCHKKRAAYVETKPFLGLQFFLGLLGVTYWQQPFTVWLVWFDIHFDAGVGRGRACDRADRFSFLSHRREASCDVPRAETTIEIHQHPSRGLGKPTLIFAIHRGNKTKQLQNEKI